MADTAALQAELEELKEARHKLLLGKGVQEVRYSGRTVAMKPADMGLLNARIRELETQLGRPGRRAPIGVSL